MSEKSTALAVIPAQSMADVATLGKAFAESGMFGCQNDAQGTVLALTCITERISPLTFKRTFHLVEGTPSMRADAMLAGFRKLGGRYKIIERSETMAKATFDFEGQSYTWQFSMEDAIKAKLPVTSKGKSKDNWTNNPKQMLWSRLVSDSVRTLTPEVVAGSYTPEELGGDLAEGAIDTPATATRVETVPVAGVDVVGKDDPPPETPKVVKPEPTATTSAPAALPPTLDATAKTVAETPAPPAVATEKAADDPNDPVLPAGAKKYAGKRVSELPVAVLTYLRDKGPVACADWYPKYQKAIEARLAKQEGK